MQRSITRGASANSGLIFHVFAQDSTSTTGAGKASVAYSSWSCRYIRNGESISGAITPEDISTIGTYAAPTANTNIRIKAVDNTNMIGVYEIHIHADWVNTTNSCQSLTIYLTASGVAVLPIQIPLIAANVQDTVRLGLTALPNAAADAAGGLPISDAGGLDLDAQRSDVASILVDTGTTLDGKIDTIDGVVDTILVDTNELQTDWVNGGRLDLLIDAILADTNELQTDWVNGGRLDLLIDAILADTNELQTDWVNGGRLDLLIDAIKVVTDAQGATGSGLTAVPWNAAWDAEVQSEVQDAIEANHLDHLLAADYDPASKPGTPTALLNELVENDGGVSRFTANTLEQAPSGGAAPTAAEVADAVWDEALAGHATEGTAGYALANVSAGASPAAIADAVWDENMAAHIASGSYGYGFDILMNRVLTTQTTEAPLPVGGGMLVEVALERATFIIMATFFDDRGDGIAPDMATWTLTDGLGNVINSRLDVVIANPEAEERIVLSGADLQKTTAKPFELRVLTLEWTYDNGKAGKEEARFYVKELVGV